MLTPLPPEQLYATCDPASLGFANTDELPELDAALIHPRAVNAMHLGLDIPMLSTLAYSPCEPYGKRVKWRSLSH